MHGLACRGVFVCFWLLIGVSWAQQISTVNQSSIAPGSTNRPKRPFDPVTFYGPEIAPLVATLGKESLEESMDGLMSDDKQYREPGYYFGGAYPQLDLLGMLSSRRMVKLLKAIEKLPEKEQEAKCRQLFAKGFTAFTNALSVNLSVGYAPYSTNPRVSESGAKGALCAGMFITADVGRADLLAGQFSQLDQFRRDLEWELQVGKLQRPAPLKPLPFEPKLLVAANLPDHRFQVNVLRLAAARSGKAELLKRVDAEIELLKMSVMEIPIVAWDARNTWFDIQIRNRGAFVDYKEGKDYTVYDWYNSVSSIDSEGMAKEEQLVRTLQETVFK